METIDKINPIQPILTDLLLLFKTYKHDFIGTVSETSIETIGMMFSGSVLSDIDRVINKYRTDDYLSPLYHVSYIPWETSENKLQLKIFIPKN